VNKEKLPEEIVKYSLWATNLSQSINPGWVIILTPLVVAFFTFLRSRKKEPSTPTKIAFGLLISALSVLVNGCSGSYWKQRNRKSIRLVVGC
jgi:POT family proton-dependent oligopeptide transporter